MGTRGAYGLRVNGEDKVTYNHWDSYPTGLGKTMVEFVHNTPLALLHTIAAQMVVVDEDSTPDAAAIKHCLGLGTQEQLAGHEPVEEEWYGLLRAAQGEPSFWVKGLRYMTDAHLFLADSLFCEWAYIINMDDRTLEVYKGFNQDPHAPGRYAHLRDREYNGVALVNVVPIPVIQEMAPHALQQLVASFRPEVAEDGEQ